jgi:hypothetical protein
VVWSELHLNIAQHCKEASTFLLLRSVEVAGHLQSDEQKLFPLRHWNDGTLECWDHYTSLKNMMIHEINKPWREERSVAL